MKKILIIGLVFILSFGLIGCGEDDNGNGDDSSVVWEEYSNDIMALSYPEQWEYEEDNPETIFFEKGEKIEELDYFVGIYVEKDDETTEEEFWSFVEKELEMIKAYERFDVISDSEISIDDEKAIEFVFKENIIFDRIDSIYYYDLISLPEELEDNGYNDYAEEIKNYRSESIQEFIDNTNSEDLEELKELLLEIKDNVDNVDYIERDRMFDNINYILDIGSLEKWEKNKGITTLYNGYEIDLVYRNIEENYDNKIGIVNHMIDSIKLLD